MVAPVIGNVASDHPCKWSTPVLDALADIVAAAAERMGDRLVVLDPCAGIGRGRLADALIGYVRQVDGVELQPEWCVDDLTMCADATQLPHPTGSYSAVVSSFVYPNRTTDHHDAKDPCGKCGGSGCWTRQGAVVTDKPCNTCKGTGLSWRNTYAHALRRHGGELVKGSHAGMGWGPQYRMTGRKILAESIRVLEPGGLLALNMSNHPATEVKGGPQVEQLVVEWWVNEVLVAGCKLWEVRRVQTRRNRFGANGKARVDGECIIVAHTPDPRRTQGRLL